jgi:hypothetical protein
MEPDELQEKTEHALETGQRAVGLTTAIVAVLLATVALLSHRSHTEAVLLQGRSVDEWNFYQAKHGRAHDYALIAEVTALLPNGKEAALRELRISSEEECGLPAEKNCKIPAKGSTVLAPLLSQMAEAGAGEKSEATAGKKPADEANAGKTSEQAKEKPAKEGAVKEGAVKIQERARELEFEQQTAERRADLYDTGELFLQISIVLCSIALLAGAKLYWRLSFITTVIGVGVAIWGWFLPLWRFPVH